MNLALLNVLSGLGREAIPHRALYSKMCFLPNVLSHSVVLKYVQVARLPALCLRPLHIELRDRRVLRRDRVHRHLLALTAVSPPCPAVDWWVPIAALGALCPWLACRSRFLLLLYLE